MKTVVNENAYKPTAWSRVVELKVLVMLDAVPGAWHEPKDIMRWIAQHSYVQSVELLDAQPKAASGKA